jgi:hypothetical protein
MKIFPGHLADRRALTCLDPAICHDHESSTVQYSTVQYSTVQYSTVQYSAVQCSTVQRFLVDQHARPGWQQPQAPMARLLHRDTASVGTRLHI